MTTFEKRNEYCHDTDTDEQNRNGKSENEKKKTLKAYYYHRNTKHDGDVIAPDVTP